MIFWKELHALGHRVRPGHHDPRRAVDDGSVQLSALCLSGGGIRSAAFALGVIQALARAGVLMQFDYLSSVSGGGYIAGWLSAWRHYAQDDAAVVAALNRLPNQGQDPPQIDMLRQNSNYLAPRMGILSADTWSAVALITRNLVMNWLVFLPLFLGVMFVPRLARSVVQYVADAPLWPRLHPFAALGAALGTVRVVASLIGRFRRSGNWIKTGRFVRWGLFPGLLASAAFTLEAAQTGARDTWPPWIVASAAIYGLGWIVAFAVSEDRIAHRKQVRRRMRADRPDPKWTRLHDPADGVALLLSGALVGFVLWLGVHLAPRLDDRALLVVLGGQWSLLAAFVGELLYVGLTSFLGRSDMEREWLGRAGGLLAAACATWAVLCAIGLYGPNLVVLGYHQLRAALVTVSLFGLISGVITFLSGASGKTAALLSGGRLSLNTLTGAAGFVFGLFLALGFAGLDAIIENWALAAGWFGPFASGAFTPAQLWCDLTVMAVLLGIGIAASLMVNVNRFSLHALYRNRLVRAFLGAARAGATPGRDPDPFTGFDQLDSIALADTVPPAGAKLLHVANMTLNVTSGNNLAWQERKAEPFTATRLHCGNEYVGYRPTCQFAGPDGLTLGTAMAVSGAAISPNMGYHSSPVVSFILTLFNLRLGWWFGNPARDAWRKLGPQPSLWPALMELAGAASADRKWVYLSDGGHFENLGLYEMIRRRCRVVVISDAGADPHSRFEDLGNAVRKIFIDQGVGIEFAAFDLPARTDPPTPGAIAAVGKIHYPHGPSGWLLYVKPGYHGNERLDVRSYAAANPRFPHETTLNQWFGESQFEAYRALGAHSMEALCNGGPVPPGIVPLACGDLETLRRRAERALRGPSSPDMTPGRTAGPQTRERGARWAFWRRK